MKQKFQQGDKVSIVGENNPFNWDKGVFRRYGKGRDADKLFVRIKSTRRTHWFYSIEVELRKDKDYGYD